jgi:hypothetical protein
MYKIESYEPLFAGLTVTVLLIASSCRCRTPPLPPPAWQK